MNHIHPTAIIDSRVVLGDNITIGAYSVIGGDPQHLAFKGEPGKVYIDDNVVIRELVTIHSAMEQQGTVIQSGCLIMALTHIGHDSIIGKNVVISTGTTIAGHSIIGDNSYLGINSSVHQWSSFPPLSILGAQSFFKGKAFQQGLKWSGVPARAFAPNEIAIRKHMPHDEAEELINDLEERLI